MTRTSLLAAAAAAAALAAFPAAASAVPTPVVDGDTITITGDDTAESIAVTTQGGLIALNGSTDLGGNTAAADDTFALVIDARGGDDTIAVNTADLASVTVDGGAGNDVITGSPEVDTLSGGDGNDRVVGAQGGDTMAGGNGNDVLVWNPGDGSDVMDGEAGADDIEVNGGSAGETFTAVPNGDRVRFDRVNPGPFNLDIGTAERLVLNANGGDDTFTADPGLALPVLLNGGVGNDTLTGGAAADLVNGGDENDTLDGGAGSDRLVGDRGADVMRGGAGDDTMVWNNGDGSDVMDGQDGLDRVEVNGAAGAGDAFEIAPNGARAKFDRTNLGPFTLDIGTSEVLDVRGQGGDDTFLARPGTPLAVIADGGAGNDVLTGAEEPDTFSGGLGNDTLTGGAGPDLLDGQDGDDSLLARDGAGDAVRGGSGTDSAQVDLADVVDAVESIDAPAVDDPDATATPVDVISRRTRVRGRRARIALECPAAEAGGCEGTITLLSRRRFRVAGNRVRIVLASAQFEIAAGERERVTVRVPRRAKRLAQNRRLRVIAQTASTDAAGNLAQDSERLTLRFRK
ncbi:MAG: calcium-binding protein [Solirubrobacteraceae bacterium]